MESRPAGRASKLFMDLQPALAALGLGNGACARSAVAHAGWLRARGAQALQTMPVGAAAPSSVARPCHKRSRALVYDTGRPGAAQLLCEPHPARAAICGDHVGGAGHAAGVHRLAEGGLPGLAAGHEAGCALLPHTVILIEAYLGGLQGMKQGAPAPVQHRALAAPAHAAALLLCPCASEDIMR